MFEVGVELTGQLLVRVVTGGQLVLDLPAACRLSATQGGRDHGSGLLLHLGEMVGTLEGLGVDLVHVLRAGRASGEPGRLRAPGNDAAIGGLKVVTEVRMVEIGSPASSVADTAEESSLSLAHECFAVRDPLDLAIVATALAGSLIGFLWWNAPPAKIIMGDTGALGLGGSLAALAVLTRTELLLIIIGGLFCVITGSVIVQRAYFKLTRGKRIFLMSPLHHHFELKGWAEVTITIRFWIIAGVFMSLGVVIFYVGWLGS